MTDVRYSLGCGRHSHAGTRTCTGPAKGHTGDRERDAIRIETPLSDHVHERHRTQSSVVLRGHAQVSVLVRYIVGSDRIVVVRVHV